MKKKKGMGAGYFFRVFFVPAMFLFAMFRFTWIRCCAMGVMVAWLCYWIMQTASGVPEQKTEEKSAVKEDTVLSQEEAFAIRQLNHRITERLMEYFPGIAWTWIKRPGVDELEAGGSWCIQLNNAEPYRYAEVSLNENGAMSLSLLSEYGVPAEAAKEEVTEVEEAVEPTVEPEPEAVSARTWYEEYGGDLLAAMIDDFNTRGYKQLTIHDDGEVCITANGKEIAANKLEWFLPRSAWSEISVLLDADEIRASEKAEGLVLRW